MAGLVAAARARELGGRVEVLEKAAAPGGSMALSSGVAWRYRDHDTFRQQAPSGDPVLQQLVLDRFDDATRWLTGMGISTTPWRENPLTSGIRFLPEELTRTLAARAGDVRLGSPLAALPVGVDVVLATGGFQGERELVRRFITPEADHMLLRAAATSTGDGLRLAQDAGAGTSAGMGEFYGRNLPAPPALVRPETFVELAQLYARHATVSTLDGEERRPREISWHETEVVQWTARSPGARAWYVVPDSALDRPAGLRTVREAIDAARRAGGRIERRDGAIAVLVAAGITTTLGGLRVDERARVLDEAGSPIPGLYAAGADAGGISTGGYSSGLAAALVLGLTAAESALGV